MSGAFFSVDIGTNEPRGTSYVGIYGGCLWTDKISSKLWKLSLEGNSGLNGNVGILSKKLCPFISLLGFIVFWLGLTVPTNTFVSDLLVSSGWVS